MLASELFVNEKINLWMYTSAKQRYGIFLTIITLIYVVIFLFWFNPEKHKIDQIKLKADDYREKSMALAQQSAILPSLNEIANEREYLTQQLANYYDTANKNALLVAKILSLIADNQIKLNKLQQLASQEQENEAVFHWRLELSSDYWQLRNFIQQLLVEDCLFQIANWSMRKLDKGVIFIVDISAYQLVSLPRENLINDES